MVVKAGKTRITFSLSDEDAEFINEVAHKRGLTKSELLLDMVSALRIRRKNLSARELLDENLRAMHRLSDAVKEREEYERRLRENLNQLR